MKKEELPSNIQPAKRLEEVNEYYFSRKLKEIAQMNAAGKQVISLGIGSPDLPPSDATIERLCQVARQSDAHGYQPTVGVPELRQAMSRFYQRWYGVSLHAQSEIQPLIGSKEGILHITLAFVNVGEKVLVPNPGYPTYTSLSRLLGADVVPYELSEESGWMPDWEALETMDLSHVKLMWLNYPHMPTGTAATRELFERAVAFARKHQIVVVNDNPYSLILNENPLSILSVEGAKDCCIELNSMSKSHNMPGWRIGMIATNSTFISWIVKVKSNIDSGTFKAMQYAAVEALDNSDDWHSEHNIAVYRNRRQWAEQIMEALGCQYSSEQVGMFLWGRIPSHYEHVEQLTERVLQEARVFITPGFIFGSQGERYIRISLCAQEEQLKEALHRIQNHIHTS